VTRVCQLLPLLLAALAMLLLRPLHAAAGEPVVGAAAPMPTLRICLPDLEAAPYLRRPGDEPGLVERLLADAARHLQIRIRITRNPVKRCILNFQNGDADAVMLSWNPLTQDMGRFPMLGARADLERRLARITMIWAQRKALPVAWDGSRYTTRSGEPIHIGTLRSVAMVSEPLRQQGYQVEDSSLTVHQLLLQLRAQRSDVVVAMSEQIQRELRSGDFDDLEILPQTATQADYYLVVSAATWTAAPRQIEALWKSIGELREPLAALQPW
jgi:hypothetical protein